MASSGPMFKAIQGGRPIETRLWPAIIVYAALALFLVRMKSLEEAAITGVLSYAVYDFTNMVIFKEYTLKFAVMDTLWGGILFSIAYIFWKKVYKNQTL